MTTERAHSLIDQLLGRDMSYAALRARAEQLARENDRLRLDNARLQQENRYLRNQQRTLRKELRLVREAYFDAACLCAWHVAGLAISRRVCQEAGMSPRKWARARALLRVGRVHNGRTLTTVNAEELHSALARAKVAIEKEPLRLQLYMARHS